MGGCPQLPRLILGKLSVRFDILPLFLKNEVNC
jgi:hypothetical protein